MSDINSAAADRLLREGWLELAALAWMRGQLVSWALCLLEAQRPGTLLELEEALMRHENGQ